MNCKKCGNPITNFDKVCPNCGEVNELYNGGNAPTEPIVNNTDINQVQQAPVQEPVTPVEPVVQTSPVMPATNVVQPIPATPETNVVQPAPASVPTQPKKKSNALFIILVIIFTLIIIGLGVFIAIKLLGGNSSGSNNGGTKTGDTTTAQETTDDTPTTVDTKNTYTYKGLTFTIPSTLKIVEKSGSTYIGNEQVVFAFSGVYSGTYDYILSSASSIEKELNDEEGKVSSHKEYVIGGKKYYVFEYLYYGKEDEPVDFFYTLLDDNIIIGGSLFGNTAQRETTYTYLNTVLSSVKTGTSEFSSGNKEIKALDTSKYKDMSIQ